MTSAIPADKINEPVWNWLTLCQSSESGSHCMTIFGHAVPFQPENGSNCVSEDSETVAQTLIELFNNVRAIGRFKTQVTQRDERPS